MRQHCLNLKPAAPYDFDLIAGYATRFRRVYGADRYEEGTYRRVLSLGAKPVLISVCDAGTIESPLLRLELQGEGLGEDEVAEVQRQTEWTLGTRNDLSAFYRMAGADPHLGGIVQRLRGLHIAHSPTVFEALVVAILGQQISFQVAAMLRTLLVQSFGEAINIGGEIHHAFPSPETLAAAGEGRLRERKLSARKAEYIARIASDVASEELDLEGLRHETSEAAVERLTAIRGVGPWTAQWMLIRALGHPDGFPSGDLALQRTMGRLVDRQSRMDPKEAERYSRRWSPHRSYVTTYLFAAVRSGRMPGLVEKPGHEWPRH